jgi:hypothetical protein
MRAPPQSQGVNSAATHRRASQIGPEGGNAGGELVHAGDPESLAKQKKSPTAPSLRLTLERGLARKPAV